MERRANFTNSKCWTYFIQLLIAFSSDEYFIFQPAKLSKPVIDWCDADPNDYGQVSVYLSWTEFLECQGVSV